MAKTKLELTQGVGYELIYDYGYRRRLIDAVFIHLYNSKEIQEQVKLLQNWYWLDEFNVVDLGNDIYWIILLYPNKQLLYNASNDKFLLLAGEPKNIKLLEKLKIIEIEGIDVISSVTGVNSINFIYLDYNLCFIPGFCFRRPLRKIVDMEKHESPSESPNYLDYKFYLDEDGVVYNLENVKAISGRLDESDSNETWVMPEITLCDGRYLVLKESFGRENCTNFIDLKLESSFSKDFDYDSIEFYSGPRLFELISFNEINIDEEELKVLWIVNTDGDVLNMDNKSYSLEVISDEEVGVNYAFWHNNKKYYFDKICDNTQENCIELKSEPVDNKSLILRFYNNWIDKKLVQANSLLLISVGFMLIQTVF